MKTAIGVLTSYSFVTERADGETYDMHRLVQATTRSRVHQQGLTEKVQTDALSHLDSIYPSEEWERREIHRAYFPHAASIYTVQLDDTAILKGDFCYKIGVFLLADASLTEALRWLEKSCRLHESLAGNNPRRLAPQHDLTRAYYTARNLQGALPLSKRVAAVEEPVLSEDHPNGIASQS